MLLLTMDKYENIDYINTQLFFVCVFVCLSEFYLSDRGDLKRIFIGSINYIPYVILSKQVCYFEFRIYKSLLCLYIVIVSKYFTIYELII